MSTPEIQKELRLWCIHAMECYLATKVNVLWVHATPGRILSASC